MEFLLMSLFEGVVMYRYRVPAGTLRVSPAVRARDARVVMGVSQLSNFILI
jgi:hypothetical protein